MSSKARLSWSERRFLALLGLPALGLTFAVTVVSTYLPVLLEQQSGPLLIGILIGGEGFFGIFLPVLVGSWSDRTSGTVGRRLRLPIVAAGIAVVGLAALGLVPTLVGTAVSLAVFYIAYYLYLAPYWALYPDVVPKDETGRSRGAESTWRLIGSGLAIITGGFLLAVWEPLPFVVAAGLLVGVTAGIVVGLRSRRDDKVPTDPTTGWRASLDSLRKIWGISTNVRRVLSAVVLWNAALSALRAFVVLFFTIGLDRSTSFVSGVIFPIAALGFVAAPFAGTLADRIGHRPVLRIALVVYGVGLLIPAFTHASWVLFAVPFVAAGAATVMTLPFSLLLRELPDDSLHGAASGAFGAARGIGSFLGPVIVGVAIELLADAPTFSDTKGYDVLWLLIGVAVLVSLPLMRQTDQPADDQRAAVPSV